MELVVVSLGLGSEGKTMCAFCSQGDVKLARKQSGQVLKCFPCSRFNE